MNKTIYAYTDMNNQDVYLDYDTYHTCVGIVIDADRVDLPVSELDRLISALQKAKEDLSKC